MTDVTDQQLREVEAVAPMCTEVMIGWIVFGLDIVEFRKLRTDDMRITDALRAGQQMGAVALSKALYQQAEAGNVDAIRYLEQTRYGVSP